MKMTITKSVLIVLGSILIVFGSLVTADATVIYQYTGNNFYLNEGDYDANDHVGVTLTFDSLLANNWYTLDASTIPGFGIVISDGVQTFNQLYGAFNYVRLQTDASGNIVEWMIYIDSSNDDNMFTTSILTAYASGDPLYPSGGISIDHGYASTSSWGACNSNPGVWSSSAPVPEPATLFLLGSGLLGVAGLRKKFKK